jgi:hypothetical protein
VIPDGSEPSHNRLVLLLGDAGLATDDEVALLRCPFVPAVERDLRAVPECTVMLSILAPAKTAL